MANFKIQSEYFDTDKNFQPLQQHVISLKYGDQWYCVNIERESLDWKTISVALKSLADKCEEEGEKERRKWLVTF